MIAFEYRPTTSLKEGVDALAMYQNFKLQKALSQIAIGSQFGDKDAIAAGLEKLGLSESAQRYKGDLSNELVKAEQEAKKDIATKAALEEYFRNEGKETRLSDVDVMNITELTNKELTEQGKKPIVMSSKAEAETLDMAKGMREKEAKESQAGIMSMFPEKRDELAKQLAYSKLSNKVLQDPENIEKLVYSAPNQSEAYARLSALANELFKRTGGLDPATIVSFQKIEEGLARLYGQEYRPTLNWAALAKQYKTGGGGGGKNKDWTIVVNNKVAEQITAPDIETAYKIANKKYKNALVYAGDAAKALTTSMGLTREFISNVPLHSQYGLKQKTKKTSFWGGDTYTVLVDENDREIPEDELQKLAYHAFVLSPMGAEADVPVVGNKGTKDKLIEEYVKYKEGFGNKYLEKGKEKKKATTTGVKG